MVKVLKGHCREKDSLLVSLKHYVKKPLTLLSFPITFLVLQIFTVKTCKSLVISSTHAC